MLAAEKYEFDPSYRGQTGPSVGVSTVGFRSNKYTPNEWHENNYAKYYQAFTDRDEAEKQRWQATRTENETQAVTHQTQALSTKKLQQRFVRLGVFLASECRLCVFAVCTMSTSGSSSSIA